MKAIRLENLRSLVDTGIVGIKPLTVLLGNNSSGKSSFLRVFPLLRQSAEVRTIGPILWYGRLVDFGTFQEALYNKANKQEIVFHFDIETESSMSEKGRMFWRVFRKSINILDDFTMSLKLSVTGDTKQGTTRAKECCLSFADHSIKIEFEVDGRISTFTINDFDVLSLKNARFRSKQAGFLIPRIINEVNLPGISINNDNRFDFQFGNILVEALTDEIHKYAWHKTGDGTIYSISRTLGVGSSEQMLNNMISNRYAGDVWKKRLKEWDVDNYNFTKLRDLVIASMTFDMLSILDSYLENMANNVYYIKPLRAYAERYHRMQDLAVDEVDSQGQNLAMFFRNLTDSEKKYFAEWTEKHFGVVPIIKSSGGQFYIAIKEIDSNIEYNLVDMGFGFSQILPIITQLWVLSNKKQLKTQRKTPVIFAIEQPELHLHPKFQAQIADSLISTIQAAKEIGIDLRLIIETHSETIINRIGHRISNKNYEPKDVSILVFTKTSENTFVDKATFDDNGFLQEWPYGFFDPEML